MADQQLMPIVLTAAGLWSVLPVAVAMGTLFRRRSLSYFLETMAIGTFKRSILTLVGLQVRGGFACSSVAAATPTRVERGDVAERPRARRGRSRTSPYGGRPDSTEPPNRTIERLYAANIVFEPNPWSPRLEHRVLLRCEDRFRRDSRNTQQLLDSLEILSTRESSREFIPHHGVEIL